MALPELAVQSVISISFQDSVLAVSITVFSILRIWFSVTDLVADSAFSLTDVRLSVTVVVCYVSSYCLFVFISIIFYFRVVALLEAHQHCGLTRTVAHCTFPMRLTSCTLVCAVVVNACSCCVFGKCGVQEGKRCKRHCAALIILAVPSHESHSRDRSASLSEIS